MSRSPSPVSTPQKTPVKIIRPPKEPVASTSKLKHPVVKAAPQTSSQPKTKAQKSAPRKLSSSTNPPKQSTPLPPPPTVASPPPSVPFVPSDLYISMMSGLAMANMPQTMQAAAATDPMVAFHLAQLCFAPPSAFPLSPLPFAPAQPDAVAIRSQIHAPKLPPKPFSDPTPKSNPWLTPASFHAPSPMLQEDSPKPVPALTPTPTSPTYVTTEMDPLALKQKRQARRHNIGWIPTLGFRDRGTFNLVPTSSYLHWSSSDRITLPDPRRSLVMEDLPLDFRTTEFVRSWSDQFPAIAVHLNGGGKALIEFPSREVAEQAYNSPRFRDGRYKRAVHVRVFWYRPQPEGVPPPSTPTPGEKTGATGEEKDILTPAASADTVTAPEEHTPMDSDDPTPPAETSQLRGKVRSKGKDKGSSLPPPERDVSDVDLPVRSTTAPTSTPRPEPPFVVTQAKLDQRQRRRSGPVDRVTNESAERPERTTSRPPSSPSPSTSSSSCSKVPSSHLRSPSPKIVQRERSPTGSPPSLRYPSSTPEMTVHEGRAPSPNGETPVQGNPFPAPTSGPSVIGDATLEQQLRMKLLAMKRTRIASRTSEQPLQTSTQYTAAGSDPDTLFKATSPPSVPQTPGDIVTSESLELLATSFITDTLKAAQGLPSEPERFDTAMSARLSKKRGSSDAFGSSADIALKRQRLAQQIEESKRIMERWIAAKTKEERNQIYVLWEESNRFVSLTCVDRALTLFHGSFPPLFLDPWSCFRSP